MKVLGREIRCHYADSKARETTISEWLDGRLMNAINGKIPSLIQYQELKNDELGIWMAQLVSNGKKTLLMITRCRMTQGANQEMQSITSQHNQMLGKIKLATHCRKEMVKDTIDYMELLNKPVDVTIGGDRNQDKASTEVQQFSNELQMKYVCQTTNGIELKKMDDTHSRGSKCIDSIEDTPNTRKHIKGSSLHEINEMINNDHRWRVIEINLEDYFKEEFSKWDKIERGVMDPNKRNHREKFNEYMNEMLDSFPIELMMANMSESTVTEKS